MLRVMSKEEIAEADKEYDEWWHQLDMVDKSQIYHFVRDVLKSNKFQDAVEAYEAKQIEKWHKDQEAMRAQFEKGASS